MCIVNLDTVCGFAGLIASGAPVFPRVVVYPMYFQELSDSLLGNIPVGLPGVSVVAVALPLDFELSWAKSNRSDLRVNIQYIFDLIIIGPLAPLALVDIQPSFVAKDPSTADVIAFVLAHLSRAPQPGLAPAFTACWRLTCMHSVLDMLIFISASRFEPCAILVTLALAIVGFASINAASSAYPRVCKRIPPKSIPLPLNLS